MKSSITKTFLKQLDDLPASVQCSPGHSVKTRHNNAVERTVSKFWCRDYRFVVTGITISAQQVNWTEQTLPSWLDSIWQGVARPEGLLLFGPSGLIKSLREVPTLLLMRLAFGTGLCRFGMFRALRANSLPQLTQTVPTPAAQV